MFALLFLVTLSANPFKNLNLSSIGIDFPVTSNGSARFPCVPNRTLAKYTHKSAPDGSWIFTNSDETLALNLSLISTNFTDSSSYLWKLQYHDDESETEWIETIGTAKELLIFLDPEGRKYLGCVEEPNCGAFHMEGTSENCTQAKDFCTYQCDDPFYFSFDRREGELGCNVMDQKWKFARATGTWDGHEPIRCMRMENLCVPPGRGYQYPNFPDDEDPFSNSCFEIQNGCNSGKTKADTTYDYVMDVIGAQANRTGDSSCTIQCCHKTEIKNDCAFQPNYTCTPWRIDTYSKKWLWRWEPSNCVPKCDTAEDVRNRLIIILASSFGGFAFLATCLYCILKRRGKAPPEGYGYFDEDHASASGYIASSPKFSQNHSSQQEGK